MPFISDDLARSDLPMNTCRKKKTQEQMDLSTSFISTKTAKSPGEGEQRTAREATSRLLVHTHIAQLGRGPAPPPRGAEVPDDGDQEGEGGHEAGVDDEGVEVAEVSDPLGDLEGQHEGDETAEGGDVDQAGPGQVRVALEHVHGADGVGAEEAEAHEAETGQEDGPVVLVLVLAGDTEDDGADERAHRRQDQIQQLVLGFAAAALLCGFVGDPVGETARDEGNGDGGEDDGHEAEAEREEGPSGRQVSGGDRRNTTKKEYTYDQGAVNNAGDAV